MVNGGRDKITDSILILRGRRTIVLEAWKKRFVNVL